MKRVNIKYLVVSLVLILSLTLGAGCDLLPEVDFPTSSSPPDSYTTTPIDSDWTLPAVESDVPELPSIADVVAKVRPSVVAINTITYDIFSRSQEGAGSGWIIDEDGIIVTNSHVVEDAGSITVTLASGETFPAEAVYLDSLTDLAIVKIDAQNLLPATIGDSSELKVGDWVVAIGNSLGLGISATKGIVSCLEVSLALSSGQTLYDLIQTDAAINPGNSGGPLVNIRGEVIGITSVKIATVGVEGMGWAISSQVAMPVVEELVQNGYVVRPWLGVSVSTVNQYVKGQYGLAVDKGALVREVVADSPADEAGLKVNDIIVSFEDQEITNAGELVQALHSYKVGQRIKITYWRGNTKNITYAVLIERPSTTS